MLPSGAGAAGLVRSVSHLTAFSKVNFYFNPHFEICLTFLFSKEQ